MSETNIAFTIRQLECFVAAAESGSITKAAAGLHASDSAVSDSIGALERSIGSVLFHRQRSKGVNLTSDGLAALPVARQILAEAETFGALVGSGPAAVSGSVRIGAGSTLSSVVLAPLIRMASERLPAVKIEVVTDDLPPLLTKLDAHELDIVVAFDPDLPPDYPTRRIASSEAHVVVAADHRLAARESVDLAELAEEPMVLLDIAASRVHTLELMSSRGLSPRIVHRTSDNEFCRSLVGEGLGYSLLMRRSIDARTWAGGEVKFLRIEPAPRPVDIVVVTLNGASPARIAAVVDLAGEISGLVQSRFLGVSAERP